MPAFERQVLTRTHGSYRGLFWAFSAFGRQRPQRWKAEHSVRIEDKVSRGSGDDRPSRQLNPFTPDLGLLTRDSPYLLSSAVHVQALRPR